MRISGSNISLVIIVGLLLLVSMVGADSEYCTTPPAGINTTIDHEGTWWNITISMPACYSCVDNGAGYGDVDCTPCSLATFHSNVTCVIYPGAIQFNDTSTDPSITDYYWEFGDGNTSILKDPVNLYIINGMYSVSHSVTNPVRTMWVNVSNYITVRSPGDSCFGSSGGGGGSSSTGTGSEVMPLIYGIVGGGAIALLFMARR